jgi:hypothetical protein
MAALQNNVLLSTYFSMTASASSRWEAGLEQESQHWLCAQALKL